MDISTVAYAVIMTTGTAGSFSLTFWRTSRPFSPGIFTSVITRSQRPGANCSTASKDLVHVATS